MQGNGRLSTEMVALSEDAARTGQHSQEKVCSLVDQVIGELHARKLPVRERFRSSLAPEQALRVVEAPEEEETIVREAAKPMHLEMSGMDD